MVRTLELLELLIQDLEMGKSKRRKEEEEEEGQIMRVELLP